MISEDHRQHIELLLKNNKKFKKLANNIFKEYNSSTNNPFDSNYESCNLHDSLSHICISPFTSDGECCSKLGYSFFTSEPLLELGVKNFDILIINHSTKYAIFVECKTSIRKGDVNNKYEAVKEIDNNKKYLESKIGNKIEHMEYVFCVPSSCINLLVKQLDEVEKNKNINPTNDPVFLIWHIDRFIKNKSLQIYIRKNNFPIFHKDRELKDLLEKGIPSITYFSPDLYPSSHPCLQGRNVISQIISENDRIIKNKDIQPDDASKIRKIFNKDFVFNYFNNERTMTHYDRETIANQLTERFLREGRKYGIIELDNNEKFILKINGEGKDTILANYIKKYKENVLKKIAEENAYKEYCKKIKDYFK